MREVRASAAYRIALNYSAAFALAIALLGVAMYFIADADFRRQQDGLLVQEATNLAHEYDEGGITDIGHAIARREAGSKITAFGYALFDAAGRRVAGSLDTVRPATGLVDIMFLDPVEGPDMARASVRDIGGGHRLVVARDTEMAEGLDQTILILFGTTLMLVIGIGVIGAVILGGYLQRRLSAMSGVANAVIAGDLSQRVPLGTRHDEFDAVGVALNTMLDRIGQLMDNLRQVSSDVAHDLRTPLLRLRNQLEQVGTVDGAAERAIAQGDAVLALFAAMLRIAEVESGALVRSFAPIDLSFLATDLAESFAPAFADGGRSLTWSVAPGIAINGDCELLAQAIVNLLDNARLHTPSGTQVELRLTGVGETAQLMVVDTGPGVPLVDHDRILQRFARGDASRTTPGNGLGLALVAAVSAAHGGTVAVLDNAPGLRVTLTLPVLVS